MKVKASASGYVKLHVPRDARLALDYDTDTPLPTPRFSEGTGLVAIALVSAPDASSTYVSVRLPRSEGAVRPVLTLGPANCQVEEHCVVPAGEYRLYVVTEAPVTVALTLQNLRGRSTVPVIEPVVAEISGASDSYYHSSPQAPAEIAAHGAGFSPTLTGARNLLFSAFWFRGSDERVGPTPADQPLLQVGNAGGCLYGGSPPGGAYAPGCPAGQGAGNFSTARALSEFGFMQWNSVANMPPGTYGRGYYAVHTGIRDPGFAAFWLDLTS